MGWLMTRVEEMQRLRDEERLTLAEIGERYGISRQRVAQLIGNQGHDVEQERLERFREERLQVIQRVQAGEISVAEASEISGISRRAFIEYARQAFEIKLSYTAPEHGTPYRYKRGCRCQECKDADRENRRQRKLRGPQVHGTYSAYGNFGCRCPECKEAAKRKYRERRRDDRHTLND